MALEERTPSDRFFIHWPEDREVRTTGSFWDAIYQDNNLLTEVLWGAQAWRRRLLGLPEPTTEGAKPAAAAVAAAVVGDGGAVNPQSAVASSLSRDGGDGSSESPGGALPMVVDLIDSLVQLEVALLFSSVVPAWKANREDWQERGKSSSPHPHNPHLILT